MNDIVALRETVIGLFKMAQNRIELVTGAYKDPDGNYSRLDTVVINSFGNITKTKGMPAGWGKLIIFEEGKNLNQVMEDTYEFYKIVESLNK